MNSEDALARARSQTPPSAPVATPSPAASGDAGWGPGTVVGRYRLLRSLGRGGLGESFLAQTMMSVGGGDSYRVIKKLLGIPTSGETDARRFLQEARAAIALRHANIAEVEQIGEWQGSFYVAMEYLHGRDLRAILKALLARSTLLPIEHVLHMIIDACAALDYAHDLVGPDGTPLHLVHRDISPQNFFCTADGQMKLLDFGLAGWGRQARETATRTMRGGVAYLSPEQCLGKTVDRRSDLFSLGVVLYEISLGVRLFRGDSDHEVMRKIVQEDATPPRSYDLSYPSDLEHVVLKALAKDPAARYQTAAEMQRDLESVAMSLRLDLSPEGMASFLADTFGDDEDEPPARSAPQQIFGHHRDDEADGDTPDVVPAVLPAGIPPFGPPPQPAGEVTQQLPALSPSATRAVESTSEVPAVRRARAPLPSTERPTVETQSVARPLRIPWPAMAEGEKSAQWPWAVGGLLLAVVVAGLALHLWSGSQPALATSEPAPLLVSAPAMAEPQPVPKTAAEPAPKTAAYPVPKAATQPALKAAAQPAPKAAAQPAPKASAQPAPKAATQPAPKPAVAAPAEAANDLGGTVSITASRHHVVFWLDGKKVGTKAPLSLSGLDISKAHTLLVTAGAKRASTSFRLAPGTPLTLDVSFHGRDRGAVRTTSGKVAKAPRSKHQHRSHHAR